MFDMSIKVAKSVVLYFHDRELIAYNFLTDKVAVLSSIGQQALSCCQHWISLSSILNYFPPIIRDDLYAELMGLINATIVTVAGTVISMEDERYEKQWTWGLLPGLFHFSIKDTKYADPISSTNWLVEHATYVPPVPLLLDNSRYSATVDLGRPTMDGVLNYMQKRRSYRGFSQQPLQLSSLSRCLFAGLGISAFGKTGVAGHDDIPLKFSPSAGGRNPFEGFVFVRNVTDINPGFYHYSGLDASLGLIADDMSSVRPGDLLAGQPWFDNAAAVIFLVAYYERTMWKYPHPSAYRVVFLEAGHIAQNILLSAAELELAAAPTSAIADSSVESLFLLDRTMNGAIYAIGLGLADDQPSQADIPQITYLPL